MFVASSSSLPSFKQHLKAQALLVRALLLMTPTSILYLSLFYNAHFAQILRSNIRRRLVVATIDADLLLLVVILVVRFRTAVFWTDSV